MRAAGQARRWLCKISIKVFPVSPVVVINRFPAWSVIDVRLSICRVLQAGTVQRYITVRHDPVCLRSPVMISPVV